MPLVKKKMWAGIVRRTVGVCAAMVTMLAKCSKAQSYYVILREIVFLSERSEIRISCSRAPGADRDSVFCLKALEQSRHFNVRFESGTN